MILNIRGAGGSGKTTLVQRLLDTTHRDQYPLIPYPSPTKREPERMKYIMATGDENLVAIGTYESKCSGCDEYSYKGAHDDLELAIEKAAGLARHVVFEGLIVSNVRKRYARLAERLADRYPTTWLFLNPPLQVCYDRIVARNGREPKMENLVPKVAFIQRQILEIVDYPFISPLVFGEEPPSDVFLQELLA